MKFFVISIIIVVIAITSKILSCLSVNSSFTRANNKKTSIVIRNKYMFLILIFIFSFDSEILYIYGLIANKNAIFL